MANIGYVILGSDFNASQETGVGFINQLSDHSITIFSIDQEKVRHLQTLKKDNIELFRKQITLKDDNLESLLDNLNLEKFNFNALIILDSTSFTGINFGNKLKTLISLSYPNIYIPKVIHYISPKYKNPCFGKHKLSEKFTFKDFPLEKFLATQEGGRLYAKGMSEDDIRRISKTILTAQDPIQLIKSTPFFENHFMNYKNVINNLFNELDIYITNLITLEVIDFDLTKLYSTDNSAKPELNLTSTNGGHLFFQFPNSPSDKRDDKPFFQFSTDDVTPHPVNSTAKDSPFSEDKIIPHNHNKP